MDTAVAQSLRIADNHQADVTFMSVIREAKSWRTAFRNNEEYSQDLDSLLKNKRSAIERRILSIAPSVNTDTVVASGIAFIEIIRRVINNQYDLVVKCAEDIDWMDRMLGSEDMHLLRKCPCPVLMLKPGEKGSLKKILATVDVMDDSGELDRGRVQGQLNNEVLEYSAAISIAESSELLVAFAWEAYAEDFYLYGAFSRLPEDRVNQYVEQSRREYSARLDILVAEMANMLGTPTMQFLQPRAYLIEGEPSREIPRLADKHDVDLIVMGTVGRVGVPGLIIGNTAESILEQTKCSVLAIKPSGFKTPVE